MAFTKPIASVQVWRRTGTTWELFRETSTGDPEATLTRDGVRCNSIAMERTGTFALTGNSSRSSIVSVDVVGGGKKLTFPLTVSR
ncbi:MAG: hypothetical protein ABL986_19010 [Vicinamibacterales bacterium]